MPDDVAPTALCDRIDRLRAQGSYQAARDEAAAAVAAATTSGERGLALVELGRGEVDLGRYDAAARAWQAVLELDFEGADPSGACLEAMGELAALTAYMGSLGEAASLAAAAADVASDQGRHVPGHVVAMALANAALVAAEVGRDADTAAWLAKARTALPDTPLTTRQGRAVFVVTLAGGQVHRMRGRYGDAETTLAKALALAEAHLGPESVEAMAVLNEMGVCAKFAGRFDDAEAAYVRAARLLDRVGGDDHPDAAALHHNLGGLAHARGDHAAAEPPARRAVELRERDLGAGHPLVLRDRAAWAAILDALGRSDEAAAILETVIERLAATLGPGHSEIAVSLNNLAAIRGRTGDLDGAAGLYERALEIKEQTAAAPASIAITRNNLAAIRRRQGHHAEAEREYRRALALLEGNVAPDHPAIMAIRSNLRSLDRSRAEIIPPEPRRRRGDVSRS